MAVNPDAIVNFVLENINQALQNNPPSLLARVKENLEKLRTQLINVKILLDEFSKYNSNGKFVKQTAREIEQVLVEAEDAVDAYVLRASVQNSKPWIPKALLPISLRNLERRIAEVTEKFKQINEEKPRTAFHVLQYQSIRNPGRHGNSTQALVVEGEPLVGLKGPVGDVVKLVIEGKESFEVVSIAGMSGLGKTTLARKVYEDPRVEDEYDIQAFVYVSRAYNKKALLLQILASFIPISDRERSMGLKDIQKLVSEKLEGKRYLIVLDDVWIPKDWDTFKGVFPNNSVRCRVLITTRNAIVAEHANPQNSNSLYKLAFLNQKHSRELLRKRVFGDKSLDSELKNYVSYVEQIASACDGLPLVILLIAGVIFSDPRNIEWWKEISKAINDASRATHVTEKIYKNQATKVIEIVYKYLPNHLKPCFLYVAMFPANFEIHVWKLVRFWISEGFIRQEENRNLEDIAERYLKELIDRNLVMVGRKRSNGGIKTVVMLETLREFCKKEAEDENIFREISKSKVSYQSLDHYRRLCIINADTLDYISEAPSGKRLRSFLTFFAQGEPVGDRLSKIPKIFRLLKVVEAESLVFNHFPAYFSSLVLLKYLAISLQQISVIPSTLSALKNLQTLVANTTSRTLDIKANIWQMPQFRHLHTNASASLPSPVAPTIPKTKNETQSSEDIQTLCNVAPEICQGQVFAATPKLKKLGISGRLAALVRENGGSALRQHLWGLEFLENLKLLNNDERITPSLPLRDLPRHLTKLTLEKTRLDWEEMSEVGKLETLEVLKLKEYAFQGAVWNTEAGGFLGLIHLYVGKTDLENWEDASVATFPKLRGLEINGCGELKVFPPGLADIPSLQSVALHCTNTQLASSAKKLQMVKPKQDSERKGFRLSVYPPPAN